MRQRLLSLALVAAVACGRAPPGASEPAVGAVLPPGQEALFSQMLGGSERLAGGCSLARASLQPQKVTAFYRCGGAPGEVAIELHHLAHAPQGAARVGALAIVARSPEARANGLFDAVSARVRARASEVRWVVARGNRPAPRPGPPRDGGAAPIGGGASRRDGVGAERPQFVEHMRGLSARWVVLGALALGVAIEVLRWRLGAGAFTIARHVARSHRLKPWQKLAAGTLVAAVVLIAVLAVVALWLRRPSTRRSAASASTRGLALMLVDEPTCYGGFAPHARQEFAREGTPLRHRFVADSEGFRLTARPDGRPAACRVLALGDSFTVGLYVEAAEVWPAVLEARLRALRRPTRLL